MGWSPFCVHNLATKAVYASILHKVVVFVVS